jgi:hypothetical protein
MSFIRKFVNRLLGRNRRGRGKKDASIYPMF